MECFTTIPLELIPVILRFAAVDALRDEPAWVAELARVSRLTTSIVQPVLYRDEQGPPDRICLVSILPHASHRRHARLERRAVPTDPAAAQHPGIHRSFRDIRGAVPLARALPSPSSIVSSYALAVGDRPSAASVPRPESLTRIHVCHDFNASPSIAADRLQAFAALITAVLEGLRRGRCAIRRARAAAAAGAVPWPPLAASFATSRH